MSGDGRCPLFVVVRGAAELPRRHRSHDRREHPDGDHRPQQASAAEARAGAREPLRHEQRLVVVRVAVVVLVDVEVSVEAEVVRVRAEEALHVRVAGQDLPAFLLQGLEVSGLHTAHPQASREGIQHLTQASEVIEFRKAESAYTESTLRQTVHQVLGDEAVQRLSNGDGARPQRIGRV